jgi:hypothetical protein
MRTIAIIFAAMMVLPLLAEAASIKDPGDKFIQHKPTTVEKDIYVVRSSGDQCALVAGSFGNPPPGAIGSAPYANKKYALAALNKLPECKGGKAPGN